MFTPLILYFSILIGLAIFCQLSLLFLGIKKNRSLPDELPQISILVAARNEKNTIIRCLESLEAMDYPKEKLEILVGNDGSTDITQQLAEVYISGKPIFSFVNITENLGRAKGKANVLAQLAQKSKGEYLFVTDADIAVKPCWALEMLKQFDKNTGIVSGVTVVRGNSTWAQWQGIDWMYFMGILQAFTNLGLPCTAVGNNMCVTRKAYEATGGYQNIDFSIVEDYALFKEIRKLGYDSKNLFGTGVLNHSLPAKDLKTLMHQRKRWIRGVKQLPLMWQAIIVFSGFYIPAMLFLLFLNWKLFLGVFGLRYLLTLLAVFSTSRKLKISWNSMPLLTFELYNWATTFLLTLFTILPIKINWKDRFY